MTEGAMTCPCGELRIMRAGRCWQGLPVWEAGNLLTGAKGHHHEWSNIPVEQVALIAAGHAMQRGLQFLAGLDIGKEVRTYDETAIAERLSV